MMIVTVCPTELTSEETLFTLQFASRVRNVNLGFARKNVNTKNLEDDMKVLRAEIKDSKKKRAQLEETCAELRKELKKTTEKMSVQMDSKMRVVDEAKKGADLQIHQLVRSNQDLTSRLQEEKDARLQLVQDLEALQRSHKKTSDQLKEVSKEREGMLQQIRAKDKEIATMKLKSTPSASSNNATSNTSVSTMLSSTQSTSLPQSRWSASKNPSKIRSTMLPRSSPAAGSRANSTVSGASESSADGVSITPQSGEKTGVKTTADGDDSAHISMASVYPLMDVTSGSLISDFELDRDSDGLSKAEVFGVTAAADEAAVMPPPRPLPAPAPSPKTMASPAARTPLVPKYESKLKAPRSIDKTIRSSLGTPSTPSNSMLSTPTNRKKTVTSMPSGSGEGSSKAVVNEVKATAAVTSSASVASETSGSMTTNTRMSIAQRSREALLRHQVIYLFRFFIY